MIEELPLIPIETKETYSPEETESLGAYVGETYPDTQVIALLGELGAGKTAFVRGLARQRQTVDQVSSPTYAIVNEYRGKRPICHFDMYRITDSDSLYDIGWEDYLSSGGLCVVEWSENILDALPEGTLFVRIEKTGEQSRRITLLKKEGEGC